MTDRWNADHKFPKDVSGRRDLLLPGGLGVEKDSWRPVTAAAAAVYVYWVSEPGKHGRFWCVSS